MRISQLLALSLLGLTPSFAVAAQGITTVKLTDDLFMLLGKGGNIGLSIGEDGAVLIDDQYAPASDAIKAAVAKLTKEPIRFVINTHWHADHTGGNENMGNAGAVIVAHENVRKHMSVESFVKAFGTRVPPAPKAALPSVTFPETITLHWNGHDIRLFHVSNAHTDSDSVVWFKDANVVHTGDVFFNGMYPFIDSGTGGSIQGMIKAVNRVLAICDDKTKIIPGHGRLANKKQLIAYRDMLVTVESRISKMIAEGKSKNEILASKPTKDLDAKWGKGFLNAARWVPIVLGAMMED